MAKRTVVARKKMPPKFLVTDLRGSIHNTSGTESGATDQGVSLFNGNRYGSRLEGVGIYRLVKVLRPKETPVEVEEVSCCEDTK